MTIRKNENAACLLKKHIQILCHLEYFKMKIEERKDRQTDRQDRRLDIHSIFLS